VGINPVQSAEMRIHMIGHASIFVETEDCRILMDPILWDPHQEDILDVCPRREVRHDRLPEFDLLVLSHRHLDHFDIRSLAYLSRDVPVLLPEDELLANFLRKLGYSRLHMLPDFSEFTAGATRLFTTRSEINVPEFGMLFSDCSGVFWNQVDSVLSQETVTRVLEYSPRIDLLLAAWQPMLEVDFQFNRPLAFPYMKYSRMLDVLRWVRPRAVAPGANAFRYRGDGAFMNNIVFPVSREQYCRDALRAHPSAGANVFELDPGDTLEFADGSFYKRAGACPFVRKLEDDRYVLAFSPVTFARPMQDSNPDRVDAGELADVVQSEMGKSLPAFLNANRDLLAIDRQWQAIHQVEVTGPDWRKVWHFNVADTTIVACVGASPYANYFCFITASTLYSMVQGRRGWDYALLTGTYRSFHKLYSVDEQTLTWPDKTKIRGPLRLRFPDDKLQESVLTQQMYQWAPAR
jgi:UDP-MurNAc hydroxylase